MRKEYDFSQGERGKFLKKGAKLRLPVYLDFKLQEQLESLARDKKREFGEMANRLIRDQIQHLKKASRRV
jgi:hypothetical protein